MSDVQQSVETNSIIVDANMAVFGPASEQMSFIPVKESELLGGTQEPALKFGDLKYFVENEIQNLSPEELSLYKTTIPIILECKSFLRNFETMEYSESAYPIFEKKYWAYIDQLFKICSDFNNPKLTEKIQKIFRGEIFEFFTQSLTYSRCYGKPFGYPGDYIMLQNLYTNEIISPTPIGKFFDRMFLNDPLSIAVIDRVNTMSSKLQHYIDTAKKQELHILNIASGSGFDLLPIASKVQSKMVHIHCFDQEVCSLIYLKEKLEKINKNAHFHFYKEDIRNFFKSGTHKRQFDYIYNIGLADYLPDRILAALMQESINALEPGGKFVIAHKDYLLFPFQYQAWPCDWHFVHRSLEDYKRFVLANLGNYKEYVISYESDKKIIYFGEFTK